MHIPDALHHFSRALDSMINDNLRLDEITFEIDAFYGAVFESQDDQRQGLFHSGW